jgi:hypothetical protein
MVAPAMYPYSRDGSGAGLRQTANRRLHPWSYILQWVWHADIAHGKNVFWHGANHIGIGLFPSGFPGRKTNAIMRFGLNAMHKLVLELARVVRQLEKSTFT